MEQNARYTLVGAFVLVCIAVAFGFIYWLYEGDRGAANARYIVYFGGSVTGLSEGSSVRYRGIPVGSVVDLRIDPNNLERIAATIEVKAGTPIKEDTAASVEMAGLTGGAFVQLSGGTEQSAVLRSSDDELAEIPSQQSGLAAIFEGAPELVEGVNELVVRVQELVSPENAQAFASIVANINTMTEMLVARQGELQQGLDDGIETAAQVRALSEELNTVAQRATSVLTTLDRIAIEAEQNISTLGDETVSMVAEIRRTAGTVSDMAASFRDTSRSVDGLVSDNRQAVQDFTATGLFELSSLLNETRQLVAGLTRISEQFERDPARFLFGDAQRGYEAN